MKLSDYRQANIRVVESNSQIIAHWEKLSRPVWNMFRKETVMWHRDP